MKSLSSEIRDLDERIEETRNEMHRLGARLAGLTAERDVLASSPGAVTDPASGKQTKDHAIVSILRSAGRACSIDDIVSALTLAGHNASYNSVSVYLNTLQKQDRVERVGRGLYTASAVEVA